MARSLTRSALAPFLLIASPHPARVLYSMAALLIILLATAGLAARAAAYRRQFSAAGAELSDHETGLVDTCTRTFVLVFLSLLGLMALGMMYGNVLGSAGAQP